MDKNIYLAQFYGKSQNYTNIPSAWYKRYDVKRGLRNEDNTGVLVGLTRVADVVGYERDADGNKVDVDGVLYYRGVDIRELVDKDRDCGYLYEEACFLLLFGYLPTAQELERFCNIIQEGYDLPEEFLEMNLLRLPGKNLMNKLQHALLTLYNYDPDPDNTDVYQTLRKGLNIMSKLPSIACYAYMSKVHFYNRQSLIIHYPRKDYSTAQNILYMLRPDSKFTEKGSLLAGCTPVPPCRSRRRHELHLYECRRRFNGYGHLLHHGQLHRRPEGPAPWRCQCEGRGNDGTGHDRSRHEGHGQAD